MNDFMILVILRVPVEGTENLMWKQRSKLYGNVSPYYNYYKLDAVFVRFDSG